MLRGSEFWPCVTSPGTSTRAKPSASSAPTVPAIDDAAAAVANPAADGRRIEVRGRVGALIEVAAGFHPDLTGRENIFLQGAIYGCGALKFHASWMRIVEFAGVGDFIDTPVKRYSTGMPRAAGISVAAHLDPDVLLIDEVLSVGDMAFQRKCVERMKELIRRGVAIVFVSHDLQAVAALCTGLSSCGRKSSPWDRRTRCSRATSGR